MIDDRYIYSISDTYIIERKNIKNLKGLVTQLCLTLCDPVDCSLPGSSVHGIPQARILGWVTISSCRGSSQSRDQTHVSRASQVMLVEGKMKKENIDARWRIDNR